MSHKHIEIAVYLLSSIDMHESSLLNVRDAWEMKTTLEYHISGPGKIGCSWNNMVAFSIAHSIKHVKYYRCVYAFFCWET